MDYEKKYKEALEKAEKNYRTAQDLCEGSQIGVECFKNTLTNIFPELRKSEDEKIRKCLKYAIDKLFLKEKIVCDVHKDDVLAWLEKQGEKDKLIKELGEYKVKYTQEVLSQQLKKQGERKSTDNLTPQEAMDIAVAKCFDEHNPAIKVKPKFKVKYAGSEYNVLEVKDIAGVTFYGIEDEPNHIDYVKADNCEIISGGYGIKENGSPYPTKPAVFSDQNPTWSEEDEQMLNDAISAVGAADYYTYDDKHKIEDWLKSLKERIGG